MTALPPNRIVEASFSAGAKHASLFPPPLGVEVAFAGRSNVGKSSLLNAIMGRKNLVRTSSTPGCTRHVGFFKTRSADGAVITLVDLPGYGYAKRSKSELKEWKELVEAYLFERPCLQTVALLVDSRRGPEDLDFQLIEALSDRKTEFRKQLPLILVATKLDKMPRSQQAPALLAIRKATKLPVMGFTTEDPAYIEALWTGVRAKLGFDATGSSAVDSEAASANSAETLGRET